MDFTKPSLALQQQLDLLAACTVGLLTRDGRAERRLASELGWRVYMRLRAEAQWLVQRRSGTPSRPTLSPAECAALYWSTLRGPDIRRIGGDMSATDLSAKLRKNPEETRKQYRGLVATYNAALGKLPDYPGIVKRRIGVPTDELAEFLGEHQEDGTVVYHGFTHSTRKREVPEEYPGNVELVILSRHGKHIAPWSRYPDEDDEVAFRLGATFRVIQTHGEAGEIFIDLTEIEGD